MGDVDGDGFDEILKGPLVIDHDGSVLWDLNLTKGHGDYLHVGDFIPSRPGLEIFKILEAGQANGIAMLDAKTGAIIWGKTTAGDAGRGYCANIDPRYIGTQCWAGQNNNNLLNFDGTVICNGTAPSANNYWAPIWWDAGVCRSLTDEHSGTDGVHIVKWNNTGCNTTEFLKTGTGTRLIQTIADVIGDWREELIIGLPNEIRIYTTTIPATNRFYTFMHNPLYRINVGQSAQRNFGPAFPDFYIGTGMTFPPVPNIYLATSPVKIYGFNNAANTIETTKLTGGLLFLSNPFSCPATISIYNLQGQSIYTDVFIGSKVISMKSFASKGVYICTIKKPNATMLSCKFNFDN
jgi:rhamnogalacturonan endolyase